MSAGINDIVNIPHNILVKLNDPSYKPIFIKFIGPTTMICVNLDLLRAYSTFFEDINSELMMTNNFQIKIEDDDVVKYIGKIFNHGFDETDEIDLFDNRQSLYLLYNQLDKFNMKKICDYVRRLIILDTGFGWSIATMDNVRIINPIMLLFRTKVIPQHIYNNFSHQGYCKLRLAVLYYRDLVYLGDIITDELKKHILTFQASIFDVDIIFNLANENVCSVNCTMCSLKTEFNKVKDDMLTVYKNLKLGYL